MIRNMSQRRRSGPPRRDADKEAGQVAMIRKMLKAGATRNDMGAAIGRNRHYVDELIRQYELAEPKPPNPDGSRFNAPLVILIEPVRWPDGPGRAATVFDREDTEEL